MNYRNILKVYKLERELAPDDLALLNTLRGMSDAERELLAESLGPPVKAKVKPKTTRKIEKCAACNYTRRAIHHQEPTHRDYHRFDDGKPDGSSTSERKSKRAESLAGKIQGAIDKTAPDRCSAGLPNGAGTCGLGPEDVLHHDQSYGNYHPFESRSRAASADTSSSSKNGSPEKSEASSRVETGAVSGATGD